MEREEKPQSVSPFTAKICSQLSLGYCVCRNTDSARVLASVEDEEEKNFPGDR